MTKNTKASSPSGDKVIFTLKLPVAWEGETIETFAYRRPKGRDMRRFTNRVGRNNSKVGDATVALLADLSEMPEAFFDELDGGDWARLSQEVNDFLPDAQ